MVLGGGGVGHRCFAAENTRAIVSGPTATKTGENWTISFELGSPCDVTVRVVDIQGYVVRHLASGMVGLKAAAKPLKPKSLSQSIVWDGIDDAGEKLPVADYKAVVTVGMSAKFDKFIIWDKDACPRSRTNNYYTAANGGCYVNQSSGVHLDTLRLFNDNGKLIRQVWPPSLNQPKDVLQKFLVGKWGATDWDGDGVPLKVYHNSWYIFGVRSGDMVCTTDGYLVSSFTGVGRRFYSLDQNDFPHAWHWRPPWYVREQTYKTEFRLTAPAAHSASAWP